jgi:multidrug resistance efflux pump
MTDTAPAAPAPQSPQPAPAPITAPPEPKKRVLWTVVAGAVAVLGVLLVLYAWRLPPFTGDVQRTDNAYVRGQVTLISPQVNGYVVEVPVKDFQTVQAGQLLAQVDDRIYRQRVEQAEASLHSAEAALANSTQSQASARGSVAQYAASIAGAEATLARAQADANRARTLKAGGWVSQANVDIAEAALRSAQAQVAQARAQQGIAETGVESAIVNRGSLQAQVENARAAVRLAQIDLANTRITAPRAGRLGEVGVRVGQYVAAGYPRGSAGAAVDRRSGRSDAARACRAYRAGRRQRVQRHSAGQRDGQLHQGGAAHSRTYRHRPEPACGRSTGAGDVGRGPDRYGKLSASGSPGPLGGRGMTAGISSRLASRQPGP